VGDLMSGSLRDATICAWWLLIMPCTSATSSILPMFSCIGHTEAQLRAFSTASAPSETLSPLHRVSFSGGPEKG